LQHAACFERGKLDSASGFFTLSIKKGNLRHPAGFEKIKIAISLFLSYSQHWSTKLQHHPFFSHPIGCSLQSA
jgi:hypothetical protein